MVEDKVIIGAHGTRTGPVAIMIQGENGGKAYVKTW